MLIGFEINKQKKYCLKYKDRCIIGAYGISFDRRAAFIYKTHSHVQGFFMRKEHWQASLEEFPDVSRSMKRNVFLDYMTKINIKVKLAKKREI